MTAPPPGAGHHVFSGDSPLPAPRADDVDRPYWEAAQVGRLAVQRCVACGRRQWPAESWCRSCLHTELEWTDIEPTGHLFSWARVWHAVHPALADDLPYVLAVVEVAPGEVRMLGNLVDAPAGDLKVGAAVRAVFEHHGDVTLVQWALAPGAGD